jgi:SecD/SecF fusion protein
MKADDSNLQVLGGLAMNDCNPLKTRRHWYRFSLRLLLLPPVAMATGCGGMSSKQVGMIVVYEVYNQKTGVAEKLDATGMQALTATIERRLNPGYRKSGRVRPLDDGRIEVSIFRAEAGEMQRIADLLPRPGTLEFRILANARDHQQLIARSKAEPESNSLSDPGGQLPAWWLPVQDAVEKRIGQVDHIATRTVTKGDREVLEVLVVKDPFDVNGSHLKRVSVDSDGGGRPCVAFTFAASGAQRFGDLTGNNLPDPTGQVYRHLGIIIDGELSTAPRIMGKVSDRGQMTGDFTRQEVQDIVDLLNAGSLPAAIRKVEQRMVDVAQQPSP